MIKVMTKDELEEWLLCWGRLYGARQSRGAHAGLDDQLFVSPHPLERARQFAPLKRAEVIRQKTAMDRGGHARRRLMGAAAGLRGILPAHFADPVGASGTRPNPATPREHPVPQVVAAIEASAIRLEVVDRVRGVILRVHYCGESGARKEKVAAANTALSMEGRFAPDQVDETRYKNALASAKVWVHSAVITVCAAGA